MICISDRFEFDFSKFNLGLVKSLSTALEETPKRIIVYEIEKIASVRPVPKHHANGLYGVLKGSETADCKPFEKKLLK